MSGTMSSTTLQNRLMEEFMNEFESPPRPRPMAALPVTSTPNNRPSSSNRLLNLDGPQPETTPAWALDMIRQLRRVEEKLDLLLSRGEQENTPPSTQTADPSVPTETSGESQNLTNLTNNTNNGTHVMRTPTSTLSKMPPETAARRLTNIMVDRLFTAEELSQGTVTGYRGKQKLDPQKIAQIKRKVRSRYGGVLANFDSVWKACLEAISIKCKKARQKNQH